MSRQILIVTGLRKKVDVLANICVINYGNVMLFEKKKHGLNIGGSATTNYVFVIGAE